MPKHDTSYSRAETGMTKKNLEAGMSKTEKLKLDEGENFDAPARSVRQVRSDSRKALGKRIPGPRSERAEKGRTAAQGCKKLIFAPYLRTRMPVLVQAVLAKLVLQG